MSMDFVNPQEAGYKKLHMVMPNGWSKGLGTFNEVLGIWVSMSNYSTGLGKVYAK